MTTALAYFVGTYLHQDWVEDYENLQGVVADYKSHESAAHCGQLVADIDEVLRRYTSETLLRSLLIDRMGSNYRAEADDMTYRQWLMRVKELLLTI